MVTRVLYLCGMCLLGSVSIIGVLRSPLAIRDRAVSRVIGVGAAPPIRVGWAPVMPSRPIPPRAEVVVGTSDGADRAYTPEGPLVDTEPVTLAAGTIGVGTVIGVPPSVVVPSRDMPRPAEVAAIAEMEGPSPLSRIPPTRRVMLVPPRDGTITGPSPPVRVASVAAPPRLRDAPLQDATAGAQTASAVACAVRTPRVTGVNTSGALARVLAPP